MTPVRRHDEIDSTNAEAMRLALSGEQGPLWVVADRQSGGRGRSGRDWVSAPGNLYASLLFTTRAPVAKAHQVSLVAGVAAFEAIAARGGPAHPELRLKWPNDILIKGRKAGGILVESTALAAGHLGVIVGIGINVVSHPEVTGGLPATHLAAHGIAPTCDDLLESLDLALIQAVSTWAAGEDFAAIRAAWMARAGPLGEGVSVNAGRERVAGRYAGLDEDGALLLDLQDGERRRCTYGDVTIE